MDLPEQGNCKDDINLLLFVGSEKLDITRYKRIIIVGNSGSGKSFSSKNSKWFYFL